MPFELENQFNIFFHAFWKVVIKIISLQTLKWENNIVLN